MLTDEQRKVLTKEESDRYDRERKMFRSSGITKLTDSLADARILSERRRKMLAERKNVLRRCLSFIRHLIKGRNYESIYPQWDITTLQDDIAELVKEA